MIKAPPGQRRHHGRTGTGQMPGPTAGRDQVGLEQNHTARPDRQPAGRQNQGERRLKLLGAIRAATGQSYWNRRGDSHGARYNANFRVMPINLSRSARGRGAPVDAPRITKPTGDAATVDGTECGLCLLVNWLEPMSEKAKAGLSGRKRPALGRRKRVSKNVCCCHYPFAMAMPTPKSPYILFYCQIQHDITGRCFCLNFFIGTKNYIRQI